MAGKNKLLIVEDDPQTAEMLCTYFSSQGYQVSTVAWGRDAIEFCQDTVPDLIIEDIRLPDIDGYGVVGALRKNLRTSHVPVVFLTERKDRKARIDGLKLGAVDYITKPFDVEELHLRVQNTLRRAAYMSLVDPVTGLPGRQIVWESIQRLVGETDWAVLYIALEGLDAFGEAYGFVAGDDVLRAMGLIVGNVLDEVGGSDGFVGHASKAELLVVTDESKAGRVWDMLVSRLSSAFDYFYPIQDLEPGRVSAPMWMAVGLAVASSGSFDTPDAIVDAAIEARQAVVAGPGTRH
jgi:PleD family two-component response regulator